MKNTTADVQKRIAELKAKKAADILEISKQLDTHMKAKAAAEADAKVASAQLDIDGFKAAKEQIARAEIGIEMYSRRLKDLEKLDFVTEEESDRVIDSLLNYEEKLAEEFEAAIVEPLKALKKLHTDYYNTILETERTISLWCSDIHKNYRSEGTTYANGSNRSPVPVPVHMMAYRGCTAAIRTESALKNMSEFM